MKEQNKKGLLENKMTELKNKKMIIVGNQLDINNFHLDEDEEINKELYLSSIKILNIASSAHYALGKEFTEIYRKLGNNKTGTYEAFIKFLGFQPRTVLRYRLRYDWINRASNLEKNPENARELMGLIGYRELEIINTLAKDEEKLKDIYEILQEDNLQLSDFKELLNFMIENKKNEVDIIDDSNLTLQKEFKVFKFFKNINLKEEEIKEVQFYLDKIKEIYNKTNS